MKLIHAWIFLIISGTGLPDISCQASWASSASCIKVYKELQVQYYSYTSQPGRETSRNKHEDAVHHGIDSSDTVRCSALWNKESQVHILWLFFYLFETNNAVQYEYGIKNYKCKYCDYSSIHLKQIMSLAWGYMQCILEHSHRCRRI